MKLIRANGKDGPNSSPGWLSGLNPHIDRRNFLRAAGVGGLGAGLFALSGPSLVKEVEAQGKGEPKAPKLEQFKTICTKCAVGCGLIGEVQNGVWVSQEPWFEHPINQGSLCAKGAAARSAIISEKRLRYPMKLVNGKWNRLSWDQAIDEIGHWVKKTRDETFTERDAGGRTVNRCEGIAWTGGCTDTNEFNYLVVKTMRSLGVVYLENQARV